jgi:hypothetical protein
MDPVSLIGGNLMNMLNAAKSQLDALKASIGKAQDLLNAIEKFEIIVNMVPLFSNSFN